MEKHSSAFTIRKAVATDCPSIMTLIKELAEFEKMPDQVDMTEDQLRNDGFLQNPKFECLIAEVDQKVVGFALFYPTYSTWKGPMMFMEDLYVTPSLRRMGIGSSLWRAVTRIAVQRGCQRLQWTCLDWNKNAIAMYEKHGGENLTNSEEWSYFRMNREAMEAFVKD